MVVYLPSARETRARLITFSRSLQPTTLARISVLDLLTHGPSAAGGKILILVSSYPMLRDGNLGFVSRKRRLFTLCDFIT
ncbi:hypothetical protein M0R45_013131 [Rubus argutus]|uniref:Uncharacterized protein n=1 Tax=Rubus argutus TaxID=59490 RepID=A0AAW1XHV8_RUBAR